MILICYDISSNSLRAKLSKRLLVAGLERINRSVFLGQVKPTALNRLNRDLQKAMLKAGPEDSLIILPVTQHQVWQMEVLGRNELDIPTITGEQHTLIL